MLDGIRLIAKEREEQVAVHGYDSTHDDQHHDPEELVRAAVHCLKPNCTGHHWPWISNSPVEKGYSRIHQLKVAGALIAAAIDQRIRAGDQNLEGRPKDADALAEGGEG